MFDDKYYHEARAHVRRLKELADDSKLRPSDEQNSLELRYSQEPFTSQIHSLQVEHLVNSLMIEGYSVKVHKNNDLFSQNESGTGLGFLGNDEVVLLLTAGILIPSNGDSECMIDRYDGRALLDFIIEPRMNRQSAVKESEAELLEAWPRSVMFC